MKQTRKKYKQREEVHKLMLKTDLESKTETHTNARIAVIDKKKEARRIHIRICRKNKSRPMNIFRPPATHAPFARLLRQAQHRCAQRPARAPRV